ncbi:MAG: diguanylate cyclase [Rubrivivax sp.]|nr:diguanylate cyclase [Rubrivivax sp.]
MTPSLDFLACTRTVWQATPDMTLRVVTAGGLVVLAAWALGRRPFSGQRSFAVLCGALALWLMISLAENAAPDIGCKTTLGLVGWSVVLLQPALWTLFLYQYLHTKPHEPPWRLRWLYAAPTLVLLALALSNSAHGLWYGPATALTPPIAGLPRARYDYGPLFYAGVASGYAWMMLAYALALRGLRTTPPGRRRQWAAFLVLMTVPLAANYAFLRHGWRLFGADPTSLAFSFVMVGFGWLATRSQVFSLVPVATQALFTHLPDPVLVIDADGRVLEANRAAQALAGVAPTLGSPLAAWPVFGQALERRLQDTAGNALITIGAPERQFEVHVEPLGEPRRPLGLLVQLHDVTERERERRHSVQRLAERLAENEAERDQWRDQAMRDALTGLWNRRALEQWFEREARSHAVLTLALLDLDHFKRINDDHGHAAGDAVLRDFAAELRTSVRAGDAVFRVGGEEFVLVLPGLDVAMAEQRLALLQAHLGERPLGGLPRPTGFSAGVADAAAGGFDLPQLLQAADEALYRAKAEGRGRTRRAA